MNPVRLVNVWCDPEPGRAAHSPMGHSLLWLPADHATPSSGPAMLYLGDWAAYPYASAAMEFGPALADAGVTCLSLCFRRRGLEGALTTAADADIRDIKLGIDFLAVRGAQPIFILAEGIGASSALRYAAKTQDTRLRGMVWLTPVAQPDQWMRSNIGNAAYAAALRRAGVAVRQGAGLDVRMEVPVSNAIRIEQYALPFLSWWAPQADFNLARNLADAVVPILVLSDETETLVAELRGEDRVAVDSLPVDPAGRVARVLDWIRAHVPASAATSIRSFTVQTSSGGQTLTGFVWTPLQAASAPTAVLLMHGLSSSPLSPLFQKMGPALAQLGFAAVAIETRRSGWAGHESALLEYDSDDIDAWIARLQQLGYQRIVLAGASMGSVSVGRYQSIRQHPAVAAIVHLMPTAECPDWFRAAAGPGPYATAVAQAEAAIAAGRGDRELIDVDVRQPPPCPYGARFRWTQRAASWLSWWGPEADSRNLVHIARARVPLLLLSGTADSYNDPERFLALREAAVQAPSVDEIWYEDVDHGLGGAEIRAAADIAAWLRRLELC